MSIIASPSYLLYKANGWVRTHKDSPLIIKSQIICIDNFAAVPCPDLCFPHRSTFDERCYTYFGVKTEVVKGYQVHCHSPKLIAQFKTRAAKVPFPVPASQCLFSPIHSCVFLAAVVAFLSFSALVDNFTTCSNFGSQTKDRKFVMILKFRETGRLFRENGFKLPFLAL